ncbi:MAG: aminotransferase class I/II-fold pyridoxal phosphate-dependent enzyme [Deltaproteobacteria bacterium]|nr:aminotransferase class I/II-fold pyridoxal phosphate-dependent enzyme [Deltaproteobacteria bacterium]
MNVILDVNVVLDLLLRRKEYFLDQKGCFQVLLERGIPLYFPVCALPTLAYVHLMELKRLKKAGAVDSEEDLEGVSRKQLSALFDEINICTTLAAHWKIIPDDHPDREDALISLSASILPGDTVIWTEDKDFRPVGEILAVGNHKTVQEALVKSHEGTQFVDLIAQQKVIRPKLELGLYSVLRHGKYIMGPEVKELEEKLAAFVGVNHCITCSSGTDALLIALMALDIGPGDEVITVPYTWISTAEVIALLNAKPVFVDIQPDTFNIDPDLIEAVITPRTKAIMPVSIYGQCADMTRINVIAEKHGIPIIEDGAQSFGAIHNGKKSCALSTIGCTSFFPSKPLGCYGDGGAIFTNDDALAEKMRQIRVHGQKVKHQHPLVGINGRLDTLQAAILLEKMVIFPEECRLRWEVGQRYNQLLSYIPEIKVPVIAEGNDSVYAQYTILTEDRDTVSNRLKAGGIPSVAYYAVPLHLQEAFADLGHKPGDFPVAEKVSAQCLSLPMHPYLTAEDQERIADALGGRSAV